jgi:ring-1,2-phenylacetyl-CoA epoxidase subunit PaaE
MAVAFHPLTIAEVRPETDESVSVTLEIPDELRSEFEHVPGQHLVLRADIDGADVRRSYSICSPPGEDRVRVGIKRIPDGVFSTYATTELTAGDVIDVMAPIGEFTAACNAEQPQRYVAFAAGSGITPILSMVTTMLRDEPGCDVTLVYGNRTTQTIMFHEELEALKNRYPERFQLVHVLSREPHEVPLFQGRIDGDKVRLLADTLIDVDGVDHWYLCGPLEMVETLTDTLDSLGVDAERVHYELFFDERIEAVPDVEESGEGLVDVSVTIDGRTSVVTVDPAGPALLDYARAVRSEVPFACKGGMCATCKAIVVEGEVTLTKNYALTPEEVEAGFILTCQAHPVGDGPLAISYDVHGGIGR